MQNKISLFQSRDPQFHTWNFFTLSYKCSIRQLPLTIYLFPVPSLEGPLLEWLMQNAFLILEVRTDIHGILKLQAILLRYFQWLFIILIMNWSQLQWIILAELQTSWNTSLAMSNCACIARNTNIFACFLWFSHFSGQRHAYSTLISC